MKPHIKACAALTHRPGSLEQKYSVFILTYREDHAQMQKAAEFYYCCENPLGGVPPLLHREQSKHCMHLNMVVWCYLSCSMSVYAHAGI